MVEPGGSVYRLRALVLGVGISLCATSAPAAATSAPTISFDLSRGPGAEACPDRDALAAQVERRLTQSRASPTVPVADRVSIAIVRAGDAYVATLSTLARSGLGGGTRRLVDDSRDCAGLAEALSLTLAMIADGRPLFATKAPEVSAPPPTPTRRPWELGAGVLGSSLLGAPTVGYSVDALWHAQPRLGAGVMAMWMPGRTIAKASGFTKVSTEIGLARLCWGVLPFGGRFFPSLCGQFGAGVLRGSSQGYADAKSASRLWLGAGGSVNAGFRLSEIWSVTAQTGVLHTLRNEQFTIGGLGSVYESTGLGWLASLDLHLRIW